MEGCGWADLAAEFHTSAGLRKRFTRAIQHAVRRLKLEGSEVSDFVRGSRVLPPIAGFDEGGPVVGRSALGSGGRRLIVADGAPVPGPHTQYVSVVIAEGL